MTILKSVQGGAGGSSAPNKVLSSNNIVALGTGTEDDLVSFVATSKTVISSIQLSGQVFAEFRILLNTIEIIHKRSGPQRNLDIFLNLELEPTDLLEVKVEHYWSGESSNFEGTILGRD